MKGQCFVVHGKSPCSVKLSKFHILSYIFVCPICEFLEKMKEKETSTVFHSILQSFYTAPLSLHSHARSHCVPVLNQSAVLSIAYIIVIAHKSHILLSNQQRIFPKQSSYYIYARSAYNIAVLASPDIRARLARK